MHVFRQPTMHLPVIVALALPGACGGRTALDGSLGPAREAGGNGGSGGLGAFTSVEPKSASGGASTAATGGASTTATGGAETGHTLAPFRTVQCMGPGIGATNESLSYDGRWFAYLAENRGRVELIDRQTGETWQVNASGETDFDLPSTSLDGTRIVYGSGPANTRRAIVWERSTQAAIASFYVGDSVRGALSADGQFLVFSTRDQTLTVPPPDPYGGIVLVNVDSKDAWQVSVSSQGTAGNDYSGSTDISKDGQRIVFQSVAMNLVAGKPSRRWDVYLHDRQTQTTSLVCHTPAGGYGNQRSYTVRISGDGQMVAFDSMASDLVPGDTEGTNDLFVLDTNTGNVSSLTLGRTTGEDSVSLIDLTIDGRLVVFGARSDAYVEEDQNSHSDAIIYDRATGNYEVASRGYDGTPLSLGGAPVAVSGNGNVVAFMTTSPELGVTSERSVLCFAERAAPTR